MMLPTPNEQELPIKWDDSQFYLPLPRHRRKLILHLLRRLQFKDVLDAGCAQHYLLDVITKQFKVKGYGCDISSKIIEANQIRAPHNEFKQVDLEKETWGNQQFDVVISSEVIEHIRDWESAVEHLAMMSKKYLLITVPGGQKRRVDEIVGHYRHFKGAELKNAIEKQGFTCLRLVRHGFPMHSLYKRMINRMAPEKLYLSFHSGKKYSFTKKLLAHGLYFAFYLNWLFPMGDQLYILAERK